LALSFNFSLNFKIVQKAQALPFEFPHPSLVDLVDRHRIEVMQLFAAAADGGDQIGVDQDVEMLRGRLAAHVEPVAERP